MARPARRQMHSGLIPCLEVAGGRSTVKQNQRQPPEQRRIQDQQERQQNKRSYHHNNTETLPRYTLPCPNIRDAYLTFNH